MDFSSVLNTHTEVRYARTPLPKALAGKTRASDYPTVMQVWEHNQARFAKCIALHYKQEGTNTWNSITWEQYYTDVKRMAKAFIKLGLEPKKSVNIIGFNSLQWYVSDFAAIFAGGIATGIYTTNTPEQCHWISYNSECQIVCVENSKQLAKFLAIKHQLPELKAIIVMDNKIDIDVHAALRAARASAGLPGEDDANAAKLVYTWDECLAMSNEVSDSVLQERIDAQKPTDCCTLIYTSGTTGNPKGVMISHANLTFTLSSLVAAVDLSNDDRIVTYLPLSHIAEQIISLYASLFVGAQVWFADPSALRGGLVDILKHVRPTLFIGVPRVWEKIQQKIKAIGENNGFLRKAIAAWAKDRGLKAGYATQEGQPAPWGTWLASTLVFNKVASNLGLDQCRMCFTSAAPISKDTLEFFLSLGLPICEIYGMSECTGPITLSLPEKYKTAKAGFPVPGVEVKIADDGEICTRGLNVFMGYFKNPAATKEVIDEQGWLHTGDVGVLDSNGFLQITDRKKELLITAGGENIAPAVLEGLLRGINVVSQAVVIGDRKPYLVALFTLDPERLPVEARQCGIEDPDSYTMEQAAKDPRFLKHLMAQVEEVNKRLAQVQTIKKFAILPRELSIDNDELTPTMKLKRRVINTNYADIIEGLYAADASAAPRD